jgi:hypothetical protein
MMAYTMVPQDAPKTYGSEENRKRLRTPAVVGGHNFLPLVRRSLNLVCTLDILFLRKDRPGSIVSNAGDLDNRLKTLFDGLRMPTAGEVDLSKHPMSADPFHCLLEDDQLITSFAVRTDRLLTRPGAPQDEVRLIVDVIVSPTQVAIASNSGFLAD